MYVIRGGPLHRQASTLAAGKLPRPMFLFCGGVAIVFVISGGITLGVGQMKRGSWVYIGAIILGVGIIMAVLSVFLTITWATQGPPSTAEYTQAPRRPSGVTTWDRTDLELNGFRGTIT